jgi:hypothetical protein
MMRRDMMNRDVVRRDMMRRDMMNRDVVGRDVMRRDPFAFVTPAEAGVQLESQPFWRGLRPYSA